MPSNQQLQEFTASHWKRMAHFAVTYNQPGIDEPLRTFLTRAYITDGSLYKGKLQNKKLRDTNQHSSGNKSDSLELKGDDLTTTTAVEAVEQCDDVAEQLADLCISADSGAACDAEEAQINKAPTSPEAIMSDEEDSCDLDEHDAELQLMAEMGLPTNFAVHQRRQNQSRRGAGSHASKRNWHQDDTEGLINEQQSDIGDIGESPKRRKSIPDVQEGEMAGKDPEDTADNCMQVYAGPHWPDYEWISTEFQRYWAASRDRCLWRAWVRRFGSYMTDETWSGMPPSLREDEEFLLLRSEVQAATPGQEFFGGLPVQDWELEWQRNEETAYWAELLKFTARYRSGSGVKQAALKLAHRLGFAYRAKPDMEEILSSHYDILPGGENISRVSYKTRCAKQRDEKEEAALAEEALQDPQLNKYWNQRYRFFDLFDNGIQLDREAWFSVTPQRIARHQAERLKCNSGLLIDAFCGAGGNAIQFAQLGGHVVAVDIDASRLTMAEHNASVYGVRERISFLCADFFDTVPRLAALADAIFLSPPWGGPNYLESDVFDLDAPVLSGGRSIADSICAALGHCRNVAVFLPRNADLGQLARLLGSCRAGIVEVEQNLLNGRLKAITVYTGCLVDAVTPDY